ncbi:hypothetical protein LAC79_32010 [Ensifer adhaerens]|nr:hypothetical protein [Ensifer adhaerens]
MWLYTPERGDLGEVTFTYSVFDGTGRSVNGALMTLMDWPANEIRGTEGDDVMRGTPQRTSSLPLAATTSSMAVKPTTSFWGQRRRYAHWRRRQRHALR